MEPSINVTMEDGRPLEELNRLIGIRSQQLQQTTKSATVAVLIDALKSIRAATSNAEKRKKFNIVVTNTGWYGGYSHSEHRPVIRSGMQPRSPKITGLQKVIWITQPTMKQQDRHVFKVVSERLQKEPYYVVCATEQEAYNYEKKASLERVKMHGGLGRNALGVAMNKISTINPPLNGSNMARAKASTLGVVEEHDSNGEYSIKVTDELDYASDALKGGRSAVSIALMKAANKVYGMLAHHSRIPIDQDFGTPFPEVRQRR